MNNEELFSNDLLIDYQAKMFGIVLLQHIVLHIENPLISYSELTKRVDLTYAHLLLGRRLEKLARFCEVNNLPNITAVVVDDRNALPGKWYYESSCAGIPNEEWYAKVEEEYAKIKASRDTLARLMFWMYGLPRSVERSIYDRWAEQEFEIIHTENKDNVQWELKRYKSFDELPDWLKNALK